MIVAAPGEVAGHARSVVMVARSDFEDER
jgi:hypothetical protein